jgi:hypothetical protein
MLQQTLLLFHDATQIDGAVATSYKLPTEMLRNQKEAGWILCHKHDPYLFWAFARCSDESPLDLTGIAASLTKAGLFRLKAMSCSDRNSKMLKPATSCAIPILLGLQTKPSQLAYKVCTASIALTGNTS